MSLIGKIREPDIEKNNRKTVCTLLINDVHYQDIVHDLWV